MKKKFVAIALVMGLGTTVAFAGSGNGSNRQKFCGINRQRSSGGSDRGW